ncbi:MAG: hypothetical protein JW751_10975 [Polyangiaceae bacterium]|nr:hypothetical protein [Polyangiaceae bacterium]
MNAPTAMEPHPSPRRSMARSVPWDPRLGQAPVGGADEATLQRLLMK